MKFIAQILRCVLASRYRVTIKGEDILMTNSPKFILPNHQALVDPPIVFSQIFRFTSAVPVVSELYFNIPVLKSVFKTMGAVPVSEITLDNRDQNTLHTVSSGVVEALQKGQNVILYPSGQIAGQGFEKIFNKQSAWSVANNLPDNVQIVGLRISGLWGSMWSRAWIGKSPNFAYTALKGAFYVFANLIFFVPRRNVTLEFYNITEEAMKQASKGKNEFNTYLESFYNAKGIEPVLFLKHLFYVSALKRELPKRIEESVEDHQKTVTITEDEIPAEVMADVVKILMQEAHQDESAIHLNANLRLDLNIDSLGLVGVITAIEQQFKHHADVEIADVKTVADLCMIALNRKLGSEVLKPSLVNQWRKPVSRILIDPSLTIPELFIRAFSQEGKETFAYDKILGTTTRKEFLMKAYVVSQIIKNEVEGKYVGIMLPALQSTTLLVAATYLAGKIPVMLNWTVGAKVMEHCIDCVNLKKIITAKSFYDKVVEVLPLSVKDKCLFFEQKVREATLATKLSGLFAFTMKQSPKVNPDDVAVILFTSGSEALPKAVELTHKNILYDLDGCLLHLNIDTHYIFLGFLPPFHSFGFTVLTILPIVTALKIAYTPDPTDSREVLKILLHTHANAVLATPTFLKMLLSIANDNDLRDLRLAVSGGESLHESVVATFKSKTGLNARLLEGYGITECSPVLAISPLELQKINSVGKFIKGVDYLITDINTHEPLSQGKEGMIMVKGNSIFKGYTDSSIESPFVVIGGEAYYRTGDLGYVDEQGYIFITGRLKRFIKIGGEMISLPAIEKVMLEKYGDPEKVVLAIEGTDQISKPSIVLFTTIDIDLNEANSYLLKAGFSALMKINSKIQIDEIPLLGTGKTDYKVLKAMIK